jgi:23S rRNA (uracil1939-C5)-methyltransferase
MRTIEQSKNKTKLEIEKLVYGGDALARLEGQVVFVPFALPGEEIEAETQPGKNKLLRATNINVLKASPHRVQPRCEYFGRCGGCQYQHSDYAYQVEQKVAILRETLRRIGKITFDRDIDTITGEPWNYRNRIQLHFDRGEVGYRLAESHELCAITHCPISSPKLNEIIGAFSHAVKQREWPTFLQALEVFTNETDVQLNVIDTARPVAARFFNWCAEFISGTVPSALNYSAVGHTFRISRGTFFQVNRFLIDALVKETLRDYEGDTALDVYAGAGLFSLPLAERFRHVKAVERGTAAYRDLEWNASEQGTRIHPAKATAEEYLRQEAGTPDLIVVDPPRAGLGPDATRELLRIGAPRVTIVSCDPATLARDLQPLSQDYEIERLALLDLFPQTFHFETVAHLRRRGAVGDC